MIKSMTAYGKAIHTFSSGRVEVEIQSVNRKHLEINLFLPSFLTRYDSEIKKWIATKIFRGQLNVKVMVIDDAGTSPVVITPNKGLARQLRDAWLDLAEDLKITLDDDTLVNILLQEEGLMVYSEEAECIHQYSKVLQQTVDDAIEYCIQMKIAEGKALEKDILARMINIELHLQEIAKKSDGATERYRQKLLQRLEEVIHSKVEDERVLKEVALFAEKVDVAEEITRLKSHLQQAKDVIHSKNNAIGKTLEFIVQEMNREANTIGSKCLDVELARYVIEIKSEIERVREQIQNVE